MPCVRTPTTVGWVVFVWCVMFLSLECARRTRCSCAVTRRQAVEACPDGAIVTVLFGGRLGNVLWEYASALALSKYLPGDRKFYSRRYIRNRLNSVFETVDTPVVEDLPQDCWCCAGVNFSAFTDHYSNFVDFDNVYKHTNTSRNVILSRYSMLLDHVLRQMDYMRNHLVYKQEYLDHAQNSIKRAKDIYLSENNLLDENALTYVGVHVRRTDFLNFLNIYKLPEVGAEYYKLCVEYFRSRTDLGRSVFLIVSDEPQWVVDNVMTNKEDNDLFLVSRGNVKTPGYDLALLSMCNHSIIDYGSYGYWGAAYAGGVTLVSNVSYFYAKIMLKNYANWHFVDVNSDGTLTLNTT